MSNFKAGDTVYLKIGSPKMIIVNLYTNETAEVAWTDSKNDIQKAEYSIAALTAIRNK